MLTPDLPEPTVGPYALAALEVLTQAVHSFFKDNGEEYVLPDHYTFLSPIMALKTCLTTGPMLNSLSI